MDHKFKAGRAVMISIVMALATAVLVHTAFFGLAVLTAWLSLASSCDYVVAAVALRETDGAKR